MYRQAYKQYQPGGDAPVGAMHYLLTYLSFIRLNTTVQRNLIIIENTESRRREKAKVRRREWCQHSPGLTDGGGATGR